MNIESISFKNNKGKNLFGRIYSNEKSGSMGLVFCHGLFSSKDGYKIRKIASSIVESGITLMTFDFSFSGESGSNIEDITIEQEIEDLNSAVIEFKKRGIDSIILAGSSMGGVVVLLYGAKTTIAIDSLITIATPADLKNLLYNNTSIEENDTIAPDGMTSFDKVPLKNAFSIEMTTIDMITNINKINVPVLILQGEKDTIVPSYNADIIKKNLSSSHKMLMIPQGDHHLSDDRSLSIIEKEITSWCRSRL